MAATARDGTLGDFLLTHLDGIAAYCDHPVRFGVVESINTTIKAVLRRARGMRDDHAAAETQVGNRPPDPIARGIWLRFLNFQRCTQIGEDRVSRTRSSRTEGSLADRRTAGQQGFLTGTMSGPC